MPGITDGRLQGILSSIFNPKFRCIEAALGTGGTTEGATSGVVTLGVAPDSDTYNYTDDIREIELWTDTTAWISVQVTKADGSVITFTILAPSRWTYTSALNESTITSVQITNLSAVTVDYSLNAVTRK